MNYFNKINNLFYFSKSLKDTSGQVCVFIILGRGVGIEEMRGIINNGGGGGGGILKYQKFCVVDDIFLHMQELKIFGPI